MPNVIERRRRWRRELRPTVGARSLELGDAELLFVALLLVPTIAVCLVALYRLDETSSSIL